jgi:DNA-binding NarL/FixJ family response regulator
MISVICLSFRPPEKARELRPDLVLTDMNRPSGLQTAGLLRAEIPEIKILITSRYDATQFCRPRC